MMRWKGKVGRAEVSIEKGMGMLRSSLVFVLAFGGASVLAGPPQTSKTVVRDTLHGVEIVDEYRWLEGDNADPARMGLPTEAVTAWTHEQNAYTRSVLDALPGRAQLEARMQQLMEVGSVGAPAMAGERYFYTKREGTQAQAVLYVRHGIDAEPVELINPNTMDASGLLTLSWFSPSDDGRLLAFGMYRAGDENSTLYLMDVERRALLADEIPGKVRAPDWLADGRRFVYGNLESTADPYSGQIKIHEVGKHWREDATLFSQRDFVEMYRSAGRYTAKQIDDVAKTWGAFGYPSEDGRWLIVGYYTATRSNDLWAMDLKHWERTGEKNLIPILVDTINTGAAGWGPIVGDTLFLRTTLDASNGRVVAVDLNNPGPSAWKTVVAHDDKKVIQSVSAARGMLAVQYLVNAQTSIERFAFDGRNLGVVELPGVGTASLSTSEDRTEAFLTFTSYNEPQSIYHVDLATNARTLWERPDVPVDPSLVEVKQVWYTSKDGTPVSMFIIHQTGIALDGNNPTILYGYGGFNIPMTPSFSATYFPWFEAGGVFAVANLRGGGEYGQSWHRAGMLEHKQNVFDDFIAAAEWLVQNGYTKPERLGIAGGSNGGLLTGAVVMQRPELFAAAISAVPLLDMVRYQDFLMARYWIPEYGSAEDADQFKFILKYSPYQNIKSGTRYPAMLITAGENDSRVHPMHARKMAAAMQAATVSDPAEAPVLLWVDYEAGHGAGKPLHLRVRDVVDQRLFMMWQLGMFNN
ncbi:MAG: S9 family peptidase [Phycisphaeraceae bacterium]|nr:S9 family peptidase [Phycisphaeraceae bacterium]MCW5762643.1 S9 family peptidase [Phycisphaeraceae bacterium]